jgi:hypothetical protein
LGIIGGLFLGGLLLLKTKMEREHESEEVAGENCPGSEAS